MTKIELIAAIQASTNASVRIEAGKPGTEDHDTGAAYLDDDGEIMVAWDSGVRTPLVVDQHVNMLAS